MILKNNQFNVNKLSKVNNYYSKHTTSNDAGEISNSINIKLIYLIVI